MFSPQEMAVENSNFIRFQSLPHKPSPIHNFFQSLKATYPTVYYIFSPLIIFVRRLRLDECYYYFVVNSFAVLKPESKLAYLFYVVCVLPILPLYVLMAFIFMPVCLFYFYVYMILVVHKPEVLFHPNSRNISILSWMPCLFEK